MLIRKTRLALGLLTLWALFWPQIVLADGMFIPELAETGYVTIRYHRVTVDIVDNHAVTHVEQAFHNPHDVPVTTHYIFPIPPGAMVTAFEATVDGDRQTVNRQDAA
ncbi:MAG: VIT domain-containing protein, partial [Anaerolineae bacterium]